MRQSEGRHFSRPKSGVKEPSGSVPTTDKVATTKKPEQDSAVGHHIRGITI